MKKALLGALAALLFSASAMADHYVQGYVRSNGTYVAPHYQSDPNSTVRDNYSYKGNVNPYTGKTGSNYYRNNPTSGYYGTSPSYGSGSSGLYGSSNSGLYGSSNNSDSDN